jgi:hypothetical protein
VFLPAGSIPINLRLIIPMSKKGGDKKGGDKKGGDKKGGDKKGGK